MDSDLAPPRGGDRSTLGVVIDEPPPTIAYSSFSDSLPTAESALEESSFLLFPPEQYYQRVYWKFLFGVLCILISVLPVPGCEAVTEGPHHRMDTDSVYFLSLKQDWAVLRIAFKWWLSNIRAALERRGYRQSC